MIDPVGLMAALALERPAFGSEADFQLALAWLIQKRHPAARVRLEYRPAYLERRGYLDVWVSESANETAIELKYWTRALTVDIGDERFELLNQGAQDVSRYDFVRDVQRVESIVLARPGARGFVIALTNDSSYWRKPTVDRATADAAFRLHEGTTLAGALGWSALTGPGTMRGREQPHVLSGTHQVVWRDYSVVAPGPAGTLRYALVQVGT